MIEWLLPPEVACAEVRGDPPEAVLLPGEDEAVAHAAEGRRREFATVRHCARLALVQLGLPPSPILRGEGGRPLWPVGVVGSMTHWSGQLGACSPRPGRGSGCGSGCARPGELGACSPPPDPGSDCARSGYRAAAVARASDMASIGIDVCRHEALPDRVVARVTLPGERARLDALARSAGRVRWESVLFSAKESIFKAWYPLTGRWLGFRDAEVTIDRRCRTFQARLLVARGSEPSCFTGRWSIADDLVFTAVTVPCR